MERLGVIEKSNSSYAAPLLMVKKGMEQIDQLLTSDV